MPRGVGPAREAHSSPAHPTPAAGQDIEEQTRGRTFSALPWRRTLPHQAPARAFLRSLPPSAGARL